MNERLFYFCITTPVRKIFDRRNKNYIYSSYDQSYSEKVYYGALLCSIFVDKKNYRSNNNIESWELIFSVNQYKQNDGLKLLRVYKLTKEKIDEKTIRWSMLRLDDRIEEDDDDVDLHILESIWKTKDLRIGIIFCKLFSYIMLLQQKGFIM